MSFSEKLQELHAYTQEITPLTPSASPNTVSTTNEDRARNRLLLRSMIAHFDSNRRAEEKARRAAGQNLDPDSDPEAVEDRLAAILASIDTTTINVVHPVHFRQLLTAKSRQGVLRNREDRAFKGLFISYFGANATWVRALPLDYLFGRLFST